MSKRLVLYKDLLTNWYPIPAIKDEIDAIFNTGVTHILICTITPAENLKLTLKDVILQWNNWVLQNQDDVKAYQQQRIKAGKYLMASFGGGNSFTIPLLVKSYPDPTTLAQNLVKFCVDNYLDGLDYDLEGAVSPIDDTTINWLVTLSKETRKAAPTGFLISHAPQAPYFCSTWAGPKMGYVEVDKQAGTSIDFYNIQYYNQGSTNYLSYNDIFVNSNTDFPGTSISEIVKSGIPVDKLVVGKPFLEIDAGSGYISCDQFAPMVSQAVKELNWNAGIMYWQTQTIVNETECYSQILSAIGGVTPPSNKCDGVNCNGIYGECNNGACKCFYGYSGKNCEIPPKCDTYNSANFKINNGVSSGSGNGTSTSKTKLWIGILLILIGISSISSGFFIKNFIKYKNIFFIIGLLSSLIGFTLITVYLSSNNSQPPINYYSCNTDSQSCTSNSQCTEDDPNKNCYIDQAACNSGCKKSTTYYSCDGDIGSCTSNSQCSKDDPKCYIDQSVCNSGCKKSPTTCDPVCQAGTICQRQTSTSGDYKCVSCSRPSTNYLCDTTKTPPNQCTLSDCTIGDNCYSNQTDCTSKCKKQLTNYLCDTTKTPPNQCTLSDCTVGGNCYSKQEECVSKCTTTPPKPGNFDFTKFIPGINVVGFDAGTGSTDNHECIPKSSVDDAINSNMKIVRFPIQPAYILKDMPNSSTYNDNLFLQSWYNTSGKQCVVGGQTWYNTTQDQPSYIDILQYAITNGLYVILDAHQNDNHLCAFGPEMTGDNFVNMWSLIATYIIKNVKNHEQVIFELYNEPTADGCQDMDPSDWNNNYVIPAIKAIKQIEKSYNSNPRIILATTWGNWSGIHSWNDDNTLPNLVSDLKKSGFTDTITSSIVIAGHQYCDSDYSGGSNNCDPSTFNTTSYTKWLTDTNNNLGDFMWFLSEGNVQCDPTTSCTNSNLYINFLNTISKDPKCLGFTVWYSGIAEYQNFNMSKNYNIYSKVYPVNGKNYDFSKFNR